MTVYGTSFVSPVWAYPSEIVPAAESLGPNIVHWIGMALSTLTPPLIAQAVGHTNMYPMFFFFGTYSFLGLVHVWWKMVDSDGYHYH